MGSGEAPGSGEVIAHKRATQRPSAEALIRGLAAIAAAVCSRPPNSARNAHGVRLPPVHRTRLSQRQIRIRPRTGRRGDDLLDLARRQPDHEDLVL